MSDAITLQDAQRDLQDQAMRVIFEAMATRQMTPSQVAALIGTSRSNVSMLFGRDGNMLISTLARYLWAAGYRATITIQPAGNGNGTEQDIGDAA